MTLRDAFAASALPAVVQSIGMGGNSIIDVMVGKIVGDSTRQIAFARKAAIAAYAIADAMLAARKA